MQNSKSILLVEDDHTDVIIVKRALKDLEITNELVHAADGKEALEYLQNGSDRNVGIILLDLNMPRMGGLEFLTIAKNSEVLKDIPVVVLTTSTNKRDIVESFRLGVVGYMVKPIDYNKFVDTIRTVNHYWTLSESPNGDGVS